jgi:type IV pilus assembly protein PilY1
MSRTFLIGELLEFRMKSIWRKRNLACLCIGFVSLAIPVTADDTEIYFGNSGASVSSINPNILFVLDTSSSMTNTVSGTGMSRLDNMKDALRTLISDANNVNMGLMRFSRAGGAIIYPVTYIDEPLDTSVAGQVSSRIVAVNDDAQQRPTGEVDLNSASVSMTEVMVGGSASAVLSIATDSDDAEERRSNGSLSTNSSDLELMLDGRAKQLIGLRFLNPPLTSTSTLVSAVIEFSDDNDSNDNTSDLEIFIKGELGGDTGSFGNGVGLNDVSSRTLTSATASWVTSTWDGSGKLRTVDLSSVIREIISDPGWSDGEALTFVLKRASGSGRRVARSRKNTSSEQPKLLLEYSSGGASVENQTVGLRFQEVGVPKGATITSATLEFVATEASSDVTSLNITAEANGNAAEFSTTAFDLGVLARPRGAESSVWTPADWATTGGVEQSVDITAVVQEVVSHVDWCGNNALALFLSGTGKRIAQSFDADPSSAPVLRIDYDPSSVPAVGSCFNREYSYRVVNSSDDGEEKSGADVYLNSSDLELVEDGGTQQIGVRFGSVQVQQGAEIQSAYLEFTSKDSQSGATSLTIYGDATDDAPTFGATTNKVSTRTKTAGVSWTPSAWSSENTYRSPDLSSIVQAIVDRGGWSAGNGMAFIIDGSGLRRAYSMNGSGGQAPRLVIQAKSSAGEASTETTRDELLEIVDGIQYKSGTPIVGSYYEAALYFGGLPVDFGAQRGNSGSSRQEHTRVSHSDSWDSSGGSVFRDAACTDSNLSSTDCRSEIITGGPNYISPIINTCQKNHIVILTDGSASYNDAASKVKALTGDSSCIDTGNQACGPELATWLRTTDQVGSLDGDQTITTHTIGFNFTGDWIKSISTNGGGDFYEAETADQLAVAFESIVTQALKSNSTFVSPAAAINQFNRLNHLSDIYFSVFKPTEDVRWEGNIKKYRLTGAGNSIVDVNGFEAVDESTGFFKDASQSFWSSTVDGAEVAQGGVAENLPAYTGPRDTYTYTGTSLDLTHTSNAVHTIGGAFNSDITKAMLGDIGMTDSVREDLLSWMAGQDVLDEDNDSSTTSRQSMADPLHSKPIVFTHSGTSVSPNMALFFGTNDGHFRAVDADSGEQLWSFIPPELLPVSKVLFDNVTAVHPYGVDGAPVLWVNDPDFNGTAIDLSGVDNFAYVYFGMRRGGRNYYALDVTNVATPEIQWVIEGGVGDFVELGQTWSRPVKTKISVQASGSPVEKDVLIFSGGYDVDQDSASIRTVDDQGRALFIVDASSGDLIWSGGPSNSFTERYNDMQYSIPASPAVADLNNDGLADQIYVGDMGGQVWRFDITNGAQVSGLVDGGVIASLAADSSVTSARRFYHTPDLTLAENISGDIVMSILIGSGYQAHPLNDSVSDRFYMIEMSEVYVAASYPYTAITESDLYNATNNDLGGTAAEILAAELLLASADGWFVQMPNLGEKVLSSPLTIDGQVVFTTYEPMANTSGCSVQPGTTREYVMRVNNATPTLDLEGDGTAPSLNVDDRSRTLATGSIVDAPVIIFTKDGGGSTFLGTTQGSINIGTDRVIKTFWYQE